MDFFTRQYPYLLVGIILSIPWLAIFLARRDLRREMLFVGVIGIFASFTDVLYIPEYWDPAFIFKPLLLPMLGLHVTLEDTLFGFFLAGIAAATYFLLEGKTLRRNIHSHHNFILAFAVFTLLFFGLEKFFPGATIYNHVFAFVVASFIVMMQRRDLIRQILLSGIFVTIYYFSMFKLMDAITGDFLAATKYDLTNLSGYYVWGAPIEELLFPLGVGMFCSVVYEYLLNFKTVALSTRKRASHFVNSKLAR